MITYKKACDMAVDEFVHRGYKRKGIVTALEDEEYWYFLGKMFEGDRVEYGPQFISIRKLDGKIDDYCQSNPNNIKHFFKLKEVDIPKEYKIIIE